MFLQCTLSDCSFFSSLAVLDDLGEALLSCGRVQRVSKASVLGLSEEVNRFVLGLGAGHFETSSSFFIQAGWW